MKKLFFSLLLFSLILLIVHPSTILAQDGSAPLDLTQTFTDSTGQFAIDYPDGWEVTESDGAIDVTSAPDQITEMSSPDLGQPGVIFMSIQPSYTLSDIDLAQNADPQTVMDTLIQALGAPVSDPESYPVGEVGLLAVFPADAFGTAADPRIVAFRDGSHTTAAIIIGDYDAFESTIAAMLSSVAYSGEAATDGGDGAASESFADTIAASTTDELSKIYIDEEERLGFVYPADWGTDMLSDGIMLSTDLDTIASPDSEALTETGALLVVIQPAYTLTDLGLSPNAEPGSIYEVLAQLAEEESPSPIEYELSDVTGLIATYPAGTFDFITESQIIAFTRDNQTTFVVVVGDYASHEATVNAVLDSVRYNSGGEGVADCPVLENPPINRVFDLDTPITFDSGISYMYPSAWDHTVVTEGYHEMRIPVAPAILIKLYDGVGLEALGILETVDATETTLDAYQHTFYPDSQRTSIETGTVMDRQVARATFRTACAGEAQVNIMQYSDGTLVLVDMFNEAGDLPNAVRDVVDAMQFALE